MTNRERWTVYPLLFLTLGIVLKDKLTRLVSADFVVCKRSVLADNVVCKTLVVTDRQQRERVVLSTTDAGGLLKAESGNPNANRRLNVLLGHVDNVAGLMFTDAHGNLLSGGVKVLLPPEKAASEKTEPEKPGAKSAGPSAPETSSPQEPPDAAHPPAAEKGEQQPE